MDFGWDVMVMLSRDSAVLYGFNGILKRSVWNCQGFSIGYRMLQT